MRLPRCTTSDTYNSFPTNTKSLNGHHETKTYFSKIHHPYFICIIIHQFGCKKKHDALVVEFPIVSEPVAITSGPKEQLLSNSKKVGIIKGKGIVIMI